jgi:exosortase
MWLVARWRWPGVAGADFSHGWLIPLISAAIVWSKRRELANTPKATSWIGLVVVVWSLFLYWIGARGQLTRISVISLIGLLWGIPFYLCGRHVARILLFPCAYLILAVPMSFLNNITVPLRLTASAVSAHILNGLGIPVRRVGTLIASAGPTDFRFGVDDPCSGLKYLIAMVALTAIYAYLAQLSRIRKWLLFLAAAPLAIIGNICRIVVIALIAKFFGWEYAEGIYHDFSGLIVFSAAVLLMIGFGRALSVNYTEHVKKWKQQATGTTA